MIIAHKNLLHRGKQSAIMPRKSFSVTDKLAIVKKATAELERGISLRKASESLGVDRCQLRRWIEQRTRFEAHVESRGSGALKAIHKGRPSCLKEHEDEILRFIFELREQGMGVTIRMVVLKASELSNAFRHKTHLAKEHAVRRFVKSHKLVHRVCTHESQRSPAAVEGEAMDWLIRIRPLLIGDNRDQRFIINMDQTPIFFTMVPRTTLNVSGARTVNLRTSTSSSMRVTAAITVTASGHQLPEFMVFKGKPGGRIEREFGSYAENHQAYGVYSVQERAWMDEKSMLKWVDVVLKPYIQTAPAGIHPILFLDSYRCHIMGSVVSTIQSLGVQVEHIPGGCTGLLQPVDVGINKPLKNRVKSCWDAWMMEQGVDTVVFNPPSRGIVAGWVAHSLRNLDSQLIKNSWRHGNFSYFPDEAQLQQIIGAPLLPPAGQQEQQQAQQQMPETPVEAGWI